MTKNNTMIVMYNLAPDQDRDAFEQWLREVDLPGYARLTTMRDPVYYRCEADLDGNPPPYAYVVAIRSEGGDSVDQEMSGPDWEGFVADFEARTRDAVYLPATRIIG